METLTKVLKEEVRKFGCDERMVDHLLRFNVCGPLAWLIRRPIFQHSGLGPCQRINRVHGELGGDVTKRTLMRAWYEREEVKLPVPEVDAELLRTLRRLFGGDVRLFWVDLYRFNSRVLKDVAAAELLRRGETVRTVSDKTYMSERNVLFIRKKLASGKKYFWKREGRV